MFFGRRKTKTNTNLPDDLLDFLEKADEAYMIAYDARNVDDLKKYMTRECVIKVSRLASETGGARYFSTDKFRETLWSIKNQGMGTLTLIKTVTYKNIRINQSYMKVSNDYAEVWSLQFTPSGWIVVNIEDCEVTF